MRERRSRRAPIRSSLRALASSYTRSASCFVFRRLDGWVCEHHLYGHTHVHIHRTHRTFAQTHGTHLQRLDAAPVPAGLGHRHRREPPAAGDGRVCAFPQQLADRLGAAPEARAVERRGAVVVAVVGWGGGLVGWGVHLGRARVHATTTAWDSEQSINTRAPIHTRRFSALLTASPRPPSGARAGCAPRSRAPRSPPPTRGTTRPCA